MSKRPRHEAKWTKPREMLHDRYCAAIKRRLRVARHSPSHHRRRYTSPEYMAAEWERVWPKMWLFAGLASDVSEPGEYFVFNLGHESILVACDDNGDIGAFYNVCQHRGARVMVNDMGWVKRLRLPVSRVDLRHGGRPHRRARRRRAFPGASHARNARSSQSGRDMGRPGMGLPGPDAAPLEEYLGPLVDEIESVPHPRHDPRRRPDRQPWRATGKPSSTTSASCTTLSTSTRSTPPSSIAPQPTSACTRAATRACSSRASP